ncbi:hypothetical protein RhiirA1_404198 [Rhizophagus irregularis]|uniref:Uncharacterized protein n=1 Tax=Rhizophagus irregularis TaxID=588596 RepID=A0A2N0QRF0_9GLOM|nr:hypothetical protein RhiirA1_404198 [Rhizophagus irregularis]
MTIKFSSIPLLPKENKENLKCNKKNLSKKHQTCSSTPSPYFRRQTLPLTTSTSKKYIGQELLSRNTNPACKLLGQLDFKGIRTKTHYFSIKMLPETIFQFPKPKLKLKLNPKLF